MNSLVWKLESQRRIALDMQPFTVFFITFSLTVLAGTGKLLAQMTESSNPSPTDVPLQNQCVVPLPFSMIDIDLPQVTTGTLTQFQSVLPITLDATGQIYVERSLANREQVVQAVTEFIQQEPEGQILLIASRTALYNDVLQILDVLRAVGGDRVSLVALPADPSSAIRTSI